MDSATIDAEIRRLLQGQREHEAIELALRTYGPELFGFLVGTLPSGVDATEAYSMLCEQLWSSHGRFEWRSSFRTWAYRIARHVASKLRRQAVRQRWSLVTDGEPPQVSAVTRTRTPPYLQTPVKTTFARLRDELPEQDQVMLVLRLDRGLSWSEIAEVLTPPSEDVGSIEREAARYRKRFERVKQRLRTRLAEQCS